MSFDEEDVRRALEARSGEPSAEYRSRVRHSIATASPGPAFGWTAIIAVILVTLLTAGSVGVLVASRHPGAAPLASAPRLTSPSPTASPNWVAAATLELSVPSANVVWALIVPDQLFRSTDGGGNWDKRTVPSGIGPRSSISFLNEREGWLLSPGSPATQCQSALADIWHTADGAASWQKVSATGIADAQCKDGIWFADSTHGFVAASDPNHRPTIYRTSDGGNRWIGSSVPDNPIFVTSPGGFTLHVNWIKAFGPTIYVQASGSQDDPSWHDRDFIYTSQDGGATWRWKQKLSSQYTYLVTESRWLQISPAVEESVNGGQAFAPYDTNLHATPPLQAVFADADTGYVATGGAILRTADAGAGWIQLNTPWPAPVVIPPSPSPSPIAMPTTADLSAPSADLVWALIGGSRLFVSSDRGQTWQERAMPKAPAGSQADEISFVDDAFGWMSTCANTTTLLWRTTDGARSWHTVSSPFPSGQCLHGLSFVDRSHGFMPVNYESGPPAVFSTPDAGDTWSGAHVANPPAFQPGQPGYAFTVLRIVRFGSVYYLAAHGSEPAGEVGWVFRSTDGGQTFTYLGSTPYPADSLGFVTSNRWLQLNAPGQSTETVDAGRSWHAFTTEYSQAAPVAPQVVFGDAEVGYASVRGSIQRTMDGGLHWKAITTPGTVQPG